jgi:signal transduction histidine kinase
MFHGFLVRKNLLMLVAIASIASSLSIVSTQHSIHTSNEIRRIASDDIVLNAQNEAYDLSRIVVNKIESVATNLQILANGPSVQSGRALDIAQLFDAAQYSTEDLTEYYMWLDADGVIVSASNIARASYQYNSIWQSEKPPFLTEPQKTATVYYSSIIKSPADNIERLYIAYPIIYSLQQDESLVGDFRGVIVAAMRLDTLGTILTSELSPTFDSDVSLTDVSGDMVYSVDRSVIGKNVFENPAYLTTPVLKELGPEAGTQIAEFLTASNSRQQAELVSIRVDDRTFTIASHPVARQGNHFWTLYITAPHLFTDNVDALLATQDAFTMITLIAIVAVAVGMTYIILSWNKRLEGIVKARTIELDSSNRSLLESNLRLEQANEQLKVHSNLQREFVNIAAHELRTPIMPILGMVDIIESKFHQARDDKIILFKSDFEIISRNSQRLERLATDILDVSRIETQSLRLNKERFDLYETIEHTVNDIKNQFPNNKVAYSIQAKKEMHIYADKSKLGQVLSNLLSNAAKFTDQGNITVAANVQTGTNDKGNMLISISDTGTGIDPEVWPRLFSKFTNKAGPERAQTGAGLGLYISKGIVEAHGGQISAENNKDGKGCTFWINIPLDGREQVTAGGLLD